MKKVLFPLLAVMLLYSCGPQNLRLAPELSGRQVSALLYIREVPEPFTRVYNWGPLYMGQRALLPSGKEEKRMKDMLLQSGLWSIVLDEMKAAAPSFEKAVKITVPDSALKALPALGPDGEADYSRFRKGPGPYLLVISVEQWGYYYNSYSNFCYYEVDLAGELINMDTGAVLWRRAPGKHDAIRMQPRECGPDALYAREALKGAVRTQIKIMADHILGKE